MLNRPTNEPAGGETKCRLRPKTGNYELVWYDRVSEEPAGRASLAIPPVCVRRIFGLSIDDPARSCYNVSPEHAGELEKLVGERLDCRRHRYFLDSVTRD